MVKEGRVQTTIPYWLSLQDISCLLQVFSANLPTSCCWRSIPGQRWGRWGNDADPHAVWEGRWLRNCSHSCSSSEFTSFSCSSHLSGKQKGIRTNRRESLWRCLRSQGWHGKAACASPLYVSSQTRRAGGNKKCSARIRFLLRRTGGSRVNGQAQGRSGPPARGRVRAKRPMPCSSLGPFPECISAALSFQRGGSQSGSESHRKGFLFRLID